jgi:hypothetical protein
MKSKSIGVATLKALGTQYSMFDNMFEQIMVLHVEFELELMEILQLVNAKNQVPKDSNSPNKTALQSSANSDPNSKSQTDTSTDENFVDDDLPSNDQLSAENAWMRKLFKRIALQCHPDKVLTSADNTEAKHQKLVMYNKARQALDDSNESSMISIGLKYDEIPVIGIKKSKTILASGVKELEVAIATKQKSIAWFWGMSEEDFSTKTKLLIQAVKQVYNKKITDDEALKIIKTFFNVHEKKKRRKVGEHPGPRLRARKNNVD